MGVMENWKTVRGFEDYAVSDLGRIKRIEALERTNVGKIMTPFPSKAGYLYPEVNHRKTKDDCRATQLEWLTKKQHVLDKVRRKQQKYPRRKQ
jgi:hypothetical protein